MIITLLGALTVVSVKSLGVGVSYAIKVKLKDCYQLSNSIAGHFVGPDNRPNDCQKLPATSSNSLPDLRRSTASTFSDCLQGLVVTCLV